MTTIDSAPTIGSVPVGAPARRLAATTRVDLLPTVIGGVVATLAIQAVTLLIFASGVIKLEVIDIKVASAADTWFGALAVMSVLAGIGTATLRRDAVLGGWTRRQQLALIAARSAMIALIAALGWLVFAVVSRPLNEFMTRLLADSGSTVEFAEVAPSLAGVALVALGAFAAGFLPLLVMALFNLHWILLTVVLLVVIGVQGLIIGAYVPLAYGDQLSAEFGFGDGSVPNIVVAVIGALAIVAAAVLLGRRMPINRTGD